MEEGFSLSSPEAKPGHCQVKRGTQLLVVPLSQKKKLKREKW